MAAKTRRLGKGLGALFPALPGESSAAESSKEQATAESTSMTNTVVSAVLPSADTQDTAHNKSDKPAGKRVNNQGKRKPIRVHDIEPTGSSNVSRETPKKGRATMPGLESMSRPSDFFFTSSADVAASPKGSMSDSDVSRETSADSSNEIAGTDANVNHTDEALTPTQELKPVEGGYLAELSVMSIGPNVHQPRTIFDEDELRELSDSIREVGVLQPIVVRKRPQEQLDALRKDAEDTADTSASDAHTVSRETRHPYDRMDSEYELIMGERRWRASQLAGLETIPAIVKTTADDYMLRDALLENLHRVALNPLEEAAAYQQMIDEFGLTQAELSRSVSKSRPQIANTLRLLNLPASVQKKVAAGVLSAGHARALLGLSDEEEMNRLATRIIAEGLSVRNAEEIVSMKTADVVEEKKSRSVKRNPWADSPIQRRLEDRFETKISIKGTSKHGRIEIVFSSPEDMERIVDLLAPQDSGASGNGWM